DSDGNFIPESVGVTFDANTLTIEETKAGTYVFYDQSSAAPLATIDIQGTVVEHITDILTETTVKEEIYQSIATQGKALENVDGALIIDGGEQAVLAKTKINIKDQGVSVNKIKPGKEGQLLITNTSGEVQWIDATDEVIKEVLASNQAITLIKDLGNGTFIYYNESCFDSDGNFIPESVGVTFDANTLTIEETEPGVFVFADKKEVLHLLDTRANHIIVDDSTLGTGHANVQEVLETLVDRMEVLDNQTGTLSGRGILINNSQSLDKAVLQDVNLSLAQAAVGTEHLQDKAVQTAQLKDGAVTERKLWAGTGRSSFVPVAQADGSVKYEAISTVLNGQGLSTDNSLILQGDASSALLQAVELQVAPNGIVSKHLENKAVTAAKVGSEAADKGAVLTANGAGGAVFMPMGEAITQVVQGDIVGDEEQSILVFGGENVLVGDSTKTVSVALAKGGVKNKHLADQTVSASKLTAGTAAVGTVAMVGEEGAVSYQSLTADVLKDKGTITTDGIITVSEDGADAVLRDITLGIADQSIVATKLNAGTAAVGTVAMVGEEGEVSYQPLTADVLKDRGTITTDGIIVASDQGVDKVLADVHLNIQEKSITAQQLANQSVSTAILEDLAVTHEKITSGTVGEGRVLLSAADGGTKWGELEQIYDEVAGNLTTDDIIIILPNNEGEEVTGTRALLKDLTLGIQDQSITNKQIANQTVQIEKLSSEGADPGMVMVTTTTGGFTYVNRESIKQKGEDLILHDGLEFLVGNGQSTVLAKTEIGIEDQGITTGKLKNGAVTTAKISSEGAANHAVLTADGQGTVTYQVLNENVFSDAGADLLSDGSIEVAAGNKALLKATTLAVAEDGIDTKHLKNQAVTIDKISSITAEIAATEGAVLLADGYGKVNFISLEQAVSEKGKPIISDTSILIQGGEQAVLQTVNFQVAPSGIQTKHLGNQVVTTDKISTKGESEGLVLVTDGEGGASYKTVSETIANSGKTVQAGDAITVLNGEQAALKDVTISLMDLGVTNTKIADQTITSIKLDAQDSPKGTILTAMGDGEARFVAMETYGRKLDTDSSLVVSSQEGILLAPASIQVNEAGIQTKHLGTKVVTIDKMSSVVGGDSQEAKKVLITDGEGGFNFGTTEELLSKGNIVQGGTISAVSGGVGAVLQDVTLEVNALSIETKHLQDKSVTSAKLMDKAVTTEKINNDAVGYTQLKRNSVYGTVIKDEAITTEKIAAKNVTAEKLSSATEKEGAVLVADGNGGVVYKSIKASMPKFFYLPSIYLDVTPGLSGSRNIYEDYAKQFGQPKYASPDAGANAKLPVLPASELNFYITYLDESIFETLSINNEGVFSYKIKEDAVITDNSYLNIVLEVKE
ncbi:hypothetical protein HX062_11140, partial [Myroides sp. DF42-4-2]|nr:hypothetical protein [Myroides sp. DF42-4-2]